MKRPTNRPLIPLALLILAALACSFPGSQAPDGATQATQTLEALATQVAATQTALAAGAPGATAPTGEETPAAEPSATETAGAPPDATPTPTVVHTTVPGSPPGASNFVTDRSSRPTAAERRTLGDNFDTLLLERPFTSQAMDYLPHLDLVRAEISAASPWVYLQLSLEDTPPQGSEALYGVEIDLNMDGRGDWLILGQAPASSDWTTEGVRVYRDANHDVGQNQPMRAEAPAPGHDGYEELVFDQGHGADPDAAWIRLSPRDAKRVQIAFKHSLIRNDGEFLWNAWADEGVRNPQWFDYNDHFSPEEAGSPVLASPHYPLKALAKVDNTCRWAFGFTPTDPLPGLCPLPATPTPEPTPQLGSISGTLWRDNNLNATIDPGELRFSAVNVRLNYGPCPGYTQTTQTSGSGAYTFSGLPAGTYCVIVLINDLPPAPYGWDPTVPDFPPNVSPFRQIELGPDEDRDGQNFGFAEIIG